MWHAEKKRTSSNQQELQAIIKMKELLPRNCDAESFADAFKEEMKRIKRTNNFAAEYAYKAIVIKVIDWSWWWVLSPAWISFAIGMLILLIAGLFMAIGYLIHRK